MVVAVHERDPGAVVFGIAAVCFVEHLLNHDGGVLDDAGGQPLVDRDRPGGRVTFGVFVIGDDVSRRARRCGRVIHRADLGHPLVVALLLAGQPGLGFGACTCLRRSGLGAQRVGAHHDPLPVGGDHQQILSVPDDWLARLVEVLEVDRGELRELFDLTFTQLLSAPPLDP